MNPNNKFTTGLIAAAIAAPLFVTPTAQATIGPKVWCMKAYGSQVPAKCDPATFPFDPAHRGLVTPTSSAYNTWPSGDPSSYLGVLWVEGNATPGATVQITVSDGVRSLVEVVTAAEEADPGTESEAGDFRALFDPVGDFGNSLASLAELGPHKADPADDPATVAFPGSGHAELSITAVAQVGADTSPPLTVYADKYAASPGDTAKPSFSNMKWPPAHWCRYSAKGAQMPGFNQHMGGDEDGRCGTFSQEPFGAIPDATWVACIEETSELPFWMRKEFADSGFPGAPDDPEDYRSPFRPFYCRTNYAQTQPQQVATIAGRAHDLKLGKSVNGSEIQDVLIQIFQGSTEIRRFENAFARTTSTEARWGFDLSINSLQPNYPGGTAYTVKVTASDAWGNTATDESPNIWVYPY